MKFKNLKNYYMITLLLSIKILLFVRLALGKVEVKNRPHIVFVLADDLGYNDVGYHRGSDIKTPCIDKLATTGTRLENYYVQPTCTPSRTQLMSGRYQIHTGMQHSNISPSKPYGLPLDNILLPEQLKACGYKTHMIGKWHLGFYKNKYLPWKRGFDSFFGILTGGASYYYHVKKDNALEGFTMYDSQFGPTMNYFGKYSTDIYSDKASDIITRHNKSKPLFLYLAHQAPHAPLENPPGLSNHYGHISNKNRRIYARMVSYMDKSICKLERNLKKASLWDNTIFIFSTDNGGTPFFGGNNWPLRGTKKTLWEGGIKAVGFVNGGHIKKLKPAVNGLFHISDWMPTLLHASKCPILRNTPPLDGINQWNILSQKGISKRREILHNIDPLTMELVREDRNTTLNVFDVRIKAAIRHGTWKLITGNPGIGDWIPPPEYDLKSIPSSTRGLVQLYNIRKDPSEKKNLASRHPGIVTWLLKKLAQYNSTSVPVVFPDSSTLSNPEFHCGFWAPWMGKKIKFPEKVCSISKLKWQQVAKFSRL
uniref:arylsulfatase J-like n=1 Tax=Styela clava TaxID=7725 RepID=UPI00193A83F9|nr:arylsulfatase J-like [Styela clava]